MEIPVTRKTLLTTATLLFPAVLMSGTADAVIVKANLGQPGTPTETGFTNWTTADSSAPAATTIAGVDLSVVVSVSDAGPGKLRSINRGDGLYAGTLDNLTDNWWGARAGTIGQPGGAQFSVIIDGEDLTAGTYDWTSWHFDHSNQTGLMDIEVSIDGGVNFSKPVDDLDIVDGTTDGFTGAPNPASFSFTANGTDDVQVRFTNDLSNGGGAGNVNFLVVNGFEFALVPEPGTLALLGLCGVMMIKRRRHG